MSQIQVQILQQDYVLSCPEGHEQELRMAVQRVDDDMERIRESGKVRARERVGVLVAVNLAYEIQRLQAQLALLEQTAQSPDGQVLQDSQRIQMLVERIDQALVSDNRLL